MKTSVRWVLGIALFAAVSFSLIACGGQKGAEPTGGKSKEPYRIGVIGSLSGPASYPAVETVNGSKAMAAVINDEGGINGHPIELVVRDDENKPELGVMWAQQMVDDQSVLAILGPVYSSVAAAVDPTTRKGKVPLVVYSAAGYKVQGPASEWTIAYAPNFEASVDMFLKEMSKQGWTKLATLNPTNISGQLAEQFVDVGLPKYPQVKVVARERYEPGATDVTPQLSKIKAGGADVLLSYGLGEEVSNIIKQMDQMGLAIPINVSSANVGTTFIKALGPVKPNRVYARSDKGSIWKTLPNDDPVKGIMQKLVTKHNALVGYEPRGHNEGLGADAAIIVGEALKKAGGDRTKIKDFLVGGNQNIRGIESVFNFTGQDRWGFRLADVIQVKIEGDQWVLAQ